MQRTIVQRKLHSVESCCFSVVRVEYSSFRDMEIDKANPTVFFASRIFGLAPYLVVTTAKGPLREFRLSIVMCAYSVLLLLSAG